MPELSRIFVHPVKSLAGVAVSTAAVRERGLRGDRSWVVVDSNGDALTQRTVPHMALVEARLEEDGVRLEARGHPSIHVRPRTEDRRTVTVWGDEVDAADGGDEGARWLSEVLGLECRLATMDARAQRHTHLAGDVPRAVRFADELPILLMSEETLDDVDRRAPVQVVAERFRPNLVVRGVSPYAEDRWRRVRIGAVELEIVKPCSRCVLVAVDPTTGARDPASEPLRTLASYRRTTDADYAHEPKQIYLGVRACVTTPGVVTLGDTLEVG